MATVPVVDTLRVSANTLPATAIRETDTAAIGGMAAQQAERLGGAMQGAGQMGMQIATDMQQQANQLLVNDALNTIKESQLDLTYGDGGYTKVKGAAAFRRDSGQSLADDYSKKLQDRIDEISTTLGNDAQRAAFKMNAQGMVMSMRERATVHETDEFKNHSLSVAEGVQATAINEIKLNYNDEKTIENAALRIDTEVNRQAKLLGKSGEWQIAKSTEMKSNAYKTALLSALENNDPAYAAGYFSKLTKEGKLTGDDAFAVRGHITREMDQKIGVERAGEVFAKFAPKIEGGPMATLESITMGSESGGRRYGKDGAMLESPKGAKGEMQVMDATNTDPGFGVRPAKDNSPDERARVGRDYLSALLSHYEGDPAKMWAAYNAGPGALDKALKAAEKNQHLGKLGTLAQNDPAIARTWKDYMPEETQKYVDKNLALLDKAQKGGNVIAKPTVQDIHQELAADPLLANNPERMKVAVAQVKQRYDDMEGALKQRGNETKIAIQQALIENGGKWNDLSPTLRAQATQYIPGEVDNLKKFNANPETDWVEYTKLRAMAASAPGAFAKTDLRLFYEKLAPQQREQLLDLQTKLKDPKNAPEVATMSQQLSTAHNLLAFGTGDAESKGRFDDAVTQAAAAETRNKGKELSYEERDKIIKRMMLKTDAPWYSSSKRMYQLVGTPDESSAKVHISDDARKLIVAALNEEGLPASEAAIKSRFNLKYGIR